MADRTTVADRIGGRWSISLRSWVAFAIMSTLAVPLSIPADADTRARAVAAAIGIVLALELGVMMAVAGRTVFRHRRERPVPLGTVIAAYALFGLIHSVTSVGLLTAFDFPDETTLPLGRIVFSIVMAPAVMIALTLIFDDIERYGRERDALLRRLIALREQGTERTELTESIEAAIQAEIRVATDPILADLSSAPANVSADERLAMAQRLETVVTTELRPLSQRLHATGQPVDVASPYVRAAIWTVFRNQRLEPWLASLVGGLFFLLFNTIRYDYRVGLAQFAVQGGLTIAILWPLAAIDARRRSEGRTFPALFIGTVLVALMTAVKGLIVQLTLVENPDLPAVAIATIWAPLVVVAVSFTVSALRNRRDDLDDLVFEVDERTLDALVTNREIVRVSRELAQHVHGTLQSTLLATAFAIESATRTNDTVAFDRAVEEARIALQTAPRLPSAETDLRDEIARRLALWEGFLDVTADIRVEERLPAPVVRDLGRALEEGISNARKHGKASAIHVTVARDSEGVRLVVADDGTGPVDGPPGLGSRILDEIAPGGWSVEAGATGGTVLTVRLPVAG